jgi:hypothetical protein
MLTNAVWYTQHLSQFTSTREVVGMHVGFYHHFNVDAKVLSGQHILVNAQSFERVNDQSLPGYLVTDNIGAAS